MWLNHWYCKFVTGPYWISSKHNCYSPWLSATIVLVSSRLIQKHEICSWCGTTKDVVPHEGQTLYHSSEMKISFLGWCCGRCKYLLTYIICAILQHPMYVFAGLGHYGVQCSDVHYCVCTHGHSDHTGNNNLFLNAKHIVGFSISCKDLYVIHPFETGEIKWCNYCQCWVLSMYLELTRLCCFGYNRLCFLWVKSSAVIVVWVLHAN